MTLNFQNRIVFPAPEHSYTPETAFGQVIYIPRDIKERLEMTAAASKKASQIVMQEAMKASTLSKFDSIHQKYR
jgi:hypothetical protein